MSRIVLFKYGLDIQGGTQLTYQADMSKIPAGEVRQTMDALRDVIELLST